MHFPLHPETPPEGRSLEELFAGRDVDAEAMYQQMKDRMDAEGLLYERRSHTYNSRLAQELGTWADTLSGDGAIHDALFKAYFVDARNVIAERRFKDAVDADWAKSRQFGVTGVPTFVTEGRGVVGAQPYEMLVQLMEAAGARPRGDGGGSQSDSS